MFGQQAKITNGIEKMIFDFKNQNYKWISKNEIEKQKQKKYIGRFLYYPIYHSIFNGFLLPLWACGSLSCDPLNPTIVSDFSGGSLLFHIFKKNLCAFISDAL